MASQKKKLRQGRKPPIPWQVRNARGQAVRRMEWAELKRKEKELEERKYQRPAGEKNMDPSLTPL